VSHTTRRAARGRRSVLVRIVVGVQAAIGGHGGVYHADGQVVYLAARK
jgi:hypothetical protein